MNNQEISGPMFIYVSGPYSPTPEESTSGHGATAIEHNIEKANAIALELAKKGHYPLVPHTMMRGWEDVYALPRELVLGICYQWVRRCDALFFIGSSSGAKQERKIATELSLPVYRAIEDVPTAKNRTNNRLSEIALQAYLVEYQECAESYRDTYATIWQSGGLLGAASGAFMAFADSAVQSIAPLPILFWYVGIFLPMNSYAEQKSIRLRNIEEELNRSIGDLAMRHFSQYDQERKQKLGLIRRLGARRWRVSHVLNVLFLVLLTIQILLVLWNWLPFIIDVM